MKINTLINHNRSFRPTKKQGLLTAAIIATTLAASGCNDDDNNKRRSQLAAATVFTASNGGGDTQIRLHDEQLTQQSSYSTGGNEGILVDSADRIVQAQDAAAPASIITACNASSRMTGDSSRTLSGATTGLSSPKGITRIDDSGLIVVANVGANNLLVFGSAAAGDQTPVATVTLGSNAWDTAYDPAGDRLFVAQVNGSVAVFDQFSSDLGQTVTPRIFTSSTALATTNFHGIDYDAAGDRLVVSDVGSAADATDGSLYVFENASTTTGSITPSVTISGSMTKLGNPVDLQLTKGNVRIAEKSNDLILVYRNVFSSSGGNIAADTEYAITKPESLAVVLTAEPNVGASDIADPATSYNLLISSNPVPASPTSGQVLTAQRNLGAAPSATFDTTSIVGLTGIENIVVDRSGDAYINFDGVTPGIAIIGAIASRSGDSFNPSRDRVIQGLSTTLVTPKGLEIADDLGLLLVSDTTVGGVVIFSACDNGDAAPRATLGGTGTPWDTDYAPSTDTLFVALTNGQLDVYDNFSADLGAAGPSRTIVPTSSGAAFSPSNLHSVRYVEDSDQLILADVGSGAVADDGALMVIDNASASDGNTDVSKRIAGSSTGLGNPVDFAFDGADLYVAEKANSGGAIQAWRNILTDSALSGNVVPSVSIASPNPESVVLLQD